ncbi:hypothetical protein Y1Q_0015048 [Alligator mississippiensis]|uniref:Gypsy retrotransposon integrase-like protein 1 n=1 Tax=Alligator mississippiensis TaxID=8496 RepID=A0A151ML43_ALLMI|nr:hypothetical protein Y1Q_0015048 [Alligator mississippiensis]
MCIELGVLEGAPVPILVRHDIMKLEYPHREEGHLLELEPYWVNVVTRQQSRKTKVGEVETSQGLVTQLATEAEGEEGETLTPSDWNQPLAIEETSNLQVRLSDSPREESGQSVAEETETLGEKFKDIPEGAGALLTGAPELSAECLVGQEKFKQEALEDPSLEELRQMAQEQETELTPDKREEVVWDKGLLYRLWVPKNHAETREPRCQLVVPCKFRQQLLSMAHDLPCAGHMGRERTHQWLQVNFYWPRIAQNVTDYCRSCEMCQLTGKSGDKRKAPLQPLPLIDQPFQRAGIEIVGPLRHKARRGKRYILTPVDFATQYPEAIALTSTEAPAVGDALTKIIFQLGFSSEILMDWGGNFLAEVMKCLWDCCGVKHLKTAAYHPQTNGLVERFSGTSKGMLKAYVDSNPNDWDEKLPHLLFAYQEVLQESTGFSPFELMFGR